MCAALDLVPFFVELSSSVSNPSPPFARVYGSVLSPVRESSRGEPSHLVPSVGAV
ncbi:hypothetical protein ABG768_012361, partial [Culter alburnus]